MLTSDLFTKKQYSLNKREKEEKKMKTSKLILLIMVICLLFNGCVAVAESPVPVKTEQPEFTAAENTPDYTNTPTVSMETATPTPAPTITRTPLPTIDKHPPTPTVERPVEWDLNPFYEKKIDTEWEGVRIKASILIDESLRDNIESINMMDSLLAEIVARTIHYVWYSRNNPDVPWASYEQIVKGSGGYAQCTLSEESVYPYMDLWSKAQKTGDYADWSKVQIRNVWMNDLSDGNGYVQKPYTIWPLFEGDAPDGVLAIKSITFVFVDTCAVKNVIKKETLNNDRIELKNPSWGTNFDNNTLFVYMGHSFDRNLYLSSSSLEDRIEEAVNNLFSSAGSWLDLNYSNPDIFKYFIRVDPNVYNSIEHWGLDVKLAKD